MKKATEEGEQDQLFRIHSELKKSEIELAKVLGIVVSR
jgi:DNA primase